MTATDSPTKSEVEEALTVLRYSSANLHDYGDILSRAIAILERRATEAELQADLNASFIDPTTLNDQLTAAKDRIAELEGALRRLFDLARHRIWHSSDAAFGDEITALLASSSPDPVKAKP